MNPPDLGEIAAAARERGLDVRWAPGGYTLVRRGARLPAGTRGVDLDEIAAELESPPPASPGTPRSSREADAPKSLDALVAEILERDHGIRR